ncbi:MAG: hypothetical protein GY696_23985, partial [Gammaproteobacteria bacterium]|nr:hypothetical protein [Gammaproteobacteria bacterium]
MNPLTLAPSHLTIDMDGLNDQAAIDQKYPAPDYIHIYTDGSLNPPAEKAGIGVVFYYNSRPLDLSFSFRENFHWAIADIELRGMTRGIQMLQTHRSLHLRALDGEYTKVVILCDCRSAISRIHNAVHCTLPPDTLIKDFLSAIEDLVEDVRCGIDHIVVQWVPGHLTAIPGNEAADQQARKGSDLSTEGRLFSLPYNVAKRMLKHSLTQNHTAFINQLGKPTAKRVLKNRHPKFKMDPIHKLPHP